MTEHTLAKPLLQAYRDRQTCIVSPAAGPATKDAAYAVQRAVWRAMVGDSRPSIWKAGAPNRHTEPTAAAIFPHRVAYTPAHFRAEDFRTLGIEAEIALCFGRDLPSRAEPYQTEEIRSAIASAHISMELVDTRLTDAEAAGPFWRLADNLLNGALVIGAAIPDWRNLDFSSLTVRILAQGHCIAETLGRPPLDDLFYCLPWWIKHIDGVKTGDIVTTGAWNGMHPVDFPAEVGVEFIGVGGVTARIG